MAAERDERYSARQRAEEAPTQDVVILLRAILGPRLVVSIAGVRTPGCVANWAQGHGRPGGWREVRLRIALELSLLIMEAEGLEAARGWMLRRDPGLGGRSPLGVIAEDPPRRARRILLETARVSLRRGDVTARLVPSGPPEATA
jgi:hypothetical protein